MAKQDLGPGVISDICKVSVNTVIRWVDSGQLKGYRIGKHRRVQRKVLAEFIQKMNLPFSDDPRLIEPEKE